MQVYSATLQDKVEAVVSGLLDSNRVQVIYQGKGRWFRKRVALSSDQHPEIESDEEEMDPEVYLPPRVQGCRNELDRPSKYLELDTFWSMLDDRDVVLIRGTWLLEQAKSKNKQLPSRGHLPQRAMVLGEHLQKLKRVASTLSQWGIPAIVSISHCWLDQNHPDPSGLLLQEIANIIEPYLDWLESMSRWCPDLKGFEGAFFFAWCSLYQPYHILLKKGEYHRVVKPCITKEEAEMHQRSLENMDMWYTHQLAEKWLFTMYFSGQGLSYWERGWPTWERAVAALLGNLTHFNTVLDLGELTRARNVHQDYVGMDTIRQECRKAKDIPLAPEDFADLLRKKTFTMGHDNRYVIMNYSRNFTTAMHSVVSLELVDGACKDEKMKLLCRTLGHCRNLQRLVLCCNNITDDGVNVLAQGLVCCKSLKHLNLQVNNIHDNGVASLVACLEGCDLSELFLDRNKITCSGVTLLVDGFKHCSKLQITLNGNPYFDEKISRSRRPTGGSLIIQHPQTKKAVQRDPDGRRPGELKSSKLEVLPLSSTNPAIGPYRVRWTLDANTWTSMRKTVVSDPIDLKFLNREYTFKLIITPAHQRRGLLFTSNFKDTCGRGTVELKLIGMDTDRLDQVKYSTFSFTIAIGNGDEIQAPRGPVMNDFLSRALRGLHRSDCEWDFNSAVDLHLMTTDVWLEISIMYG